jgi:spermidine/putrescine transport system permease protein
MRALSRIIAEEVYFIFSCPALLWQIIFLYTPFTILALHSLIDYIPATGSYILTLGYYSQIFKSLYIKIIFRSFFLAVTTAIACFFIAYPVAYYLALKVNKRYKTMLLFSLILPSWTSLIVQVYAWFFLLEKNGFISQILQTLRIISPSFHLLNNYFSIILGMVSCYLPFMILPIYTVLEKMDKRFLEASADLGADRFETFKRIVFPLSLPGVYAGVMLVFIPAFGEYAIPTLLGGSKYVFWGSVIVDKFLRSRDWRVGAALVIVGIMLPVLLMVSSYLGSKISALMKEKRERAANNSIYKDVW